MYIASTSSKGLHHLVWEIVDNSIDEALAGIAHTISITVDKDNVITVEDDGRGMDNPDITTAELMGLIKGPDFPTGGYILGRSGIRQAFETGRGCIVIRSKSRIETLPNGKQRIIVYEIPYMTF